MVTYFTIFLLTLALAFAVRDRRGGISTKVLFLVFVPLFLFGASRIDCMDMEEYEYFYKSTHGNQFYDSVNERIEIGYSFLNFILPSFRILIILQTCILIASYMFVCKKYVSLKYLWLFICLFFLSGEKTVYFLTAMRNTIAIAIMLFSLPFIAERKTWKFAGVTLFASLFHTSALLFLPLAYVIGRNTKVRKWELATWLLVLVLLLIIPVSLFVDHVSDFIIDNRFEKYSAYLENVHENGLMVKLSTILFAGLILYDITKNPINNIHLMLGRLSLLFVYFPLLGTLNARATYYYCMVIILYAVYSISNEKKLLYRNIFVILLAIYMAYAFFIVDGSSQYSGLLTFKTLIDINL